MQTMDTTLNMGQKRIKESTHTYYVCVYIYILYTFLLPLGINVDWEEKGRGREFSLSSFIQNTKIKIKNNVQSQFIVTETFEEHKHKSAAAGF